MNIRDALLEHISGKPKVRRRQKLMDKCNTISKKIEDKRFHARAALDNISRAIQMTSLSLCQIPKLISSLEILLWFLHLRTPLKRLSKY
jgi:hypothetical protein